MFNMKITWKFIKKKLFFLLCILFFSFLSFAILSRVKQSSLKSNIKTNNSSQPYHQNNVKSSSSEPSINSTEYSSYKNNAYKFTADKKDLNYVDSELRDSGGVNWYIASETDLSIHHYLFVSYDHNTTYKLININSTVLIYYYICEINKKLYACTSNGIYVSGNEGTLWTLVENQYNITYIYYSFYNKAIYGIIGTYENSTGAIFYSLDECTTWTIIKTHFVNSLIFWRIQIANNSLFLICYSFNPDYPDLAYYYKINSNDLSKATWTNLSFAAYPEDCGIFTHISVFNDQYIILTSYALVVTIDSKATIPYLYINNSFLSVYTGYIVNAAVIKVSSKVCDVFIMVNTKDMNSPKRLCLYISEDPNNLCVPIGYGNLTQYNFTEISNKESIIDNINDNILSNNVINAFWSIYVEYDVNSNAHYYLVWNIITKERNYFPFIPSNLYSFNSSNLFLDNKNKTYHTFGKTQIIFDKYKWYIKSVLVNGKNIYSSNTYSFDTLGTYNVVINFNFVAYKTTTQWPSVSFKIIVIDPTKNPAIKNIFKSWIDRKINNVGGWPNNQSVCYLNNKTKYYYAYVLTDKSKNTINLSLNPYNINPELNLLYSYYEKIDSTGKIIVGRKYMFSTTLDISVDNLKNTPNFYLFHFVSYNSKEINCIVQVAGKSKALNQKIENKINYKVVDYIYSILGIILLFAFIILLYYLHKKKFLPELIRKISIFSTKFNLFIKENKKLTIFFPLLFIKLFYIYFKKYLNEYSAKRIENINYQSNIKMISESIILTKDEDNIITKWVLINMYRHNFKNFYKILVLNSYYLKTSLNKNYKNNLLDNINYYSNNNKSKNYQVVKSISSLDINTNYIISNFTKNYALVNNALFTKTSRIQNAKLLLLLFISNFLKTVIGFSFFKKIILFYKSKNIRIRFSYGKGIFKSLNNKHKVLKLGGIKKIKKASMVYKMSKTDSKNFNYFINFTNRSNSYLSIYKKFNNNYLFVNGTMSKNFKINNKLDLLMDINISKSICMILGMNNNSLPYFYVVSGVYRIFMNHKTIQHKWKIYIMKNYKLFNYIWFYSITNTSFIINWKIKY